VNLQSTDQDTLADVADFILLSVFPDHHGTLGKLPVCLSRTARIRFSFRLRQACLQIINFERNRCDHIKPYKVISICGLMLSLNVGWLCNRCADVACEKYGRFAKLLQTTGTGEMTN